MLIAFAGVATGQAAAEYGAGAAGAGVMAGPSKAVGAAFNSLEKALKSALDPVTPKTAAVAPAPIAPAAAPVKSSTVKPKTAAITTAVPAPTAKVAPPPPEPTYEDPTGIKVGLAYYDVLERFGPPSLEVVTGPSTKTLSYMTKDGPFHVECLDGKVTSAGKS